jgi:Domain of unknown function (DUF4407)
MVAILAAILMILAVLAAVVRGGVLARLGGARPEILARATADAQVFNARGIAAIIPALLATLAMTVALEYGQQLKFVPAAVAGAVWGLIVLLLDLSIMNVEAGTDGAWPWVRSAIFLVLRGAVAVLAALMISSMIVLFWYRTDVATQLQRDNQAAALSYDHTYIDPQYDPQIQQDQSQAAADQVTLAADAKTVTSDRQAVSRAKLLMQCEAGGVSDLAGCPAGTGRAGRGQVYDVRAAEYRNAVVALGQAEAAQRADQAQLPPMISKDEADASDLQHKRDHAEARELTFQDSHNGLLGRQRALSQLERANPGIGLYVTGLELLVLLIDCSAIIVKITTRTPAYDRAAQSARHRAIRYAELADAQIDTEVSGHAQISAAQWQARVAIEVARSSAWQEIEQARIRVWRDAAFAGLGGVGPRGTVGLP